jgi:hypothetical protein
VVDYLRWCCDETGLKATLVVDGGLVRIVPA